MLKLKGYLRYLLVLLMIIAVLTFLGISKGTDGNLEIWVFDVGQGDAILIRTPNDHQILIDGGPDNTILEKLGSTLPFWDKSLDFVVLTHPHADHLSGLVEVAKRYEVGQFLVSGIGCNNAMCKEWQKELDQDSDKALKIEVGQKITFDDGVEIEILAPNKAMLQDENLNNTSIVLKLNYKQFDAIFTGDAEIEEQDAILGEGMELQSEVLKVAHHGSTTGVNQNFYQAINPEMAVISVGKDNPFGHPHQDALELFSGIKILRTDLLGDIKIWSSPEDYFYKSFN